MFMPRLLMALGLFSLPSAAFAADPQPAAHSQIAVRRLPDVVIAGRIAKPSVHFVLARRYHAPTTLLSHDLWREQLERISAGERR